MIKMLERYQNCTYSSMEVNRSANDAEVHYEISVHHTFAYPSLFFTDKIFSCFDHLAKQLQGVHEIES